MYYSSFLRNGGGHFEKWRSFLLCRGAVFQNGLCDASWEQSLSSGLQNPSIFSSVVILKT